MATTPSKPTDPALMWPIPDVRELLIGNECKELEIKTESQNTLNLHAREETIKAIYEWSGYNVNQSKFTDSTVIFFPTEFTKKQWNDIGKRPMDLCSFDGLPSAIGNKMIDGMNMATVSKVLQDKVDNDDDPFNRALQPCERMAFWGFPRNICLKVGNSKMSATKKIKVCQSSIPVPILCSFIMGEVRWLRENWEIMVPNETGPIGDEFSVKSPSDPEPMPDEEISPNKEIVRMPDGNIRVLVSGELQTDASMAASAASSSVPKSKQTLSAYSGKAMKRDGGQIVNEDTIPAVESAKKNKERLFIGFSGKPSDRIKKGLIGSSGKASH